MSSDGSSTVNQKFNAPVTNVAGRDIIQTSVTSVNILRVLETAVNKSEAIPESQKAGLIEKIRGLAQNPYISGLATSAIYEGLKSFISMQH